MDGWPGTLVLGIELEATYNRRVEVTRRLFFGSSREIVLPSAGAERYTHALVADGTCDEYRVFEINWGRLY